jgi:hypothetical protein
MVAQKMNHIDAEITWSSRMEEVMPGISTVCEPQMANQLVAACDISHQLE